MAKRKTQALLTLFGILFCDVQADVKWFFNYGRAVDDISSSPTSVEANCDRIIEERGSSAIDCRSQPDCEVIMGWMSSCNTERCVCECFRRLDTLHVAPNAQGVCDIVRFLGQYDEKCARHADCDPDLQLECISRRCKCQEGYTWNQRLGQCECAKGNRQQRGNKCVSDMRLGATCLEDDDCEQGAGKNWRCNSTRHVCECKPEYEHDIDSSTCILREVGTVQTSPIQENETVTSTLSEQRQQPSSETSQLVVYTIVSSILALFLFTTCVVGVILRKRNRARLRNFEAGDIANTTRSEFTIDETEVLGRGKCGVVYCGQFRSTRIAVKTLNPDCRRVDMYMDSLDKEIEIFGLLREHENIVKLFGYCNHESSRFLLMELCDLGSLRNFLANNAFFDFADFPIPDAGHSDQPVYYSYKDLLRFATQIATGAKFLAEHRIVHGDLACRNILLGADRIAKITDFGLARKLGHSPTYIKSTNDLKPWKWSAPEVLLQNKFSIQSDVWSFGVTLWEIFSLGEEPYQGLEYHDAFPCELYQGFHRLANPKLAPIQLYNLLKNCWQSEREDRIGFPQLRLQLTEFLHVTGTADDLGYHGTPVEAGTNGYVPHPDDPEPREFAMEL